MNGFKASVFWALLAWSCAAQSALHKCVDEAGNTRYSDSPCPEASEAERLPMPGSALSVVEKRGPELPGVHPSWLVLPGESGQELSCGGRSCVCGDYEVRHRSREPEQRLLRAIEMLPEQWLDYENATAELRLRKWHNLDRDSGYDLNRTSCHLRISQRTVEMYYEDYLAPLLKRPQVEVTTLRHQRQNCQRPTGDEANSGDAWLAYEQCENKGLEGRAAIHHVPSSRDYSLQRLQKAFAVLQEPRPGWVP
ncbi:DUF4124 domain-containing protein [Pseudomarimonas arenosa]|uniref:DUF4124 domain-containing protein n=1 Tax=Pseudomarimonas arenosa TaxID=2774145 RepID=A0AAW3ZRF8_9GAMM|nr:DUF4124 domain-containing protein [Pseudomarimonas arenosa]MBD8527657.1 DUF4124 domain-containing protein [Pseudomarimonas arenosa]